MREIVSRAVARERGLADYFTGKPCGRGHVALRNVKGKHCKECVSLLQAKFRAKFTDEEWGTKERARNMAYIVANRHKKRATSRASMAKAYAADPQKFIDRSRSNEIRLAVDNPEMLRLSGQARRAAHRVRQMGEISERGLTAVVRRVWEASEGKCAVCHSEDDLELDHILALANGGTNDEDNLQFLCEPCNRSKGKKDFNAWLAGRAEITGVAA